MNSLTISKYNLISFGSQAPTLAAPNSALNSVQGFSCGAPFMFTEDVDAVAASEAGIMSLATLPTIVDASEIALSEPPQLARTKAQDRK
jgi:hypothetical protein